MKTKAKIFIIKTLDFILKIWYNIRALRLRAKEKMKTKKIIFIEQTS